MFKIAFLRVSINNINISMIKNIHTIFLYHPYAYAQVGDTMVLWLLCKNMHIFDSNAGPLWMMGY